MACCSVVSHWCKWCMLQCSQRALILVLEHVGNFGVRLPPSCSRYGVRVHCLCVQILSFYATRWPVLPSCMQLTLVSWYVASMLCCHCWMFSLSRDTTLQGLPTRCEPELTEWPREQATTKQASETSCLCRAVGRVSYIYTVIPSIILFFNIPVTIHSPDSQPPRCVCVCVWQCACVRACVCVCVCVACLFSARE